MENLPEFILNHWELWTSLVILLIILFIYEYKTRLNQAKMLSPQETTILVNQNANLFDIRAPEKFSSGHIINSISVKAEDYQAKNLAKYHKKPVILVCQKGITCQKVASQWMQAGFSELSILEGGIDAWKEAGFPLVKPSKK